MPEHAVTQFMSHIGIEAPQARFNDVRGKYVTDGFVPPATNVNWAPKDADTDRPIMNVLEILTLIMNVEPSPKIYETVATPDGGTRRRVVDKDTKLVAQAYETLQEEWDLWLEGQTDLREELAEIFNNKFRRVATRAYNGDHIVTPGVSEGWEWRGFQKNVIARIVQSGNTYMAHAVGAGKTSAMIGAAMEMKRLGMINKPMFVVPNPMLRQFSREFVQQYPAANLAVADETQFQGDRRRQFVASVGLDNTLDAVIMTHSSFGKIPLSLEFRQNIVAEEISDLREALQDLDTDAPRYMRSQIQQQIEKLERSLTEQRDADQVFTFEEMGVDQLFIDEAHNFRKMGLKTSQNVKGIDSTASNRARALYEKIRYMRTLHPGRGVVFASGTPVVNTMGEAYNISRYLQEEKLRALGIHRFDDWSATFGRVEEIFEADPAGNFKYVRRFAKFVNRPELVNMVSEVVDYISPEELSENVVRPAVKGGREMKLSNMTEAQEAYQVELKARVKAIEEREGPPEKGDDIMLTVITDGRKMAIDSRLIDPSSANEPQNKLNNMVHNVFEIWKSSENQKFYRPDSAKMAYSKEPIMTGPATQIIFASLGLKGEFSVVRWIKAELKRQGVPAEQIAFINDYKSSKAKQRLFNDMREGKVRVLIGHPETLGTGVNVQNRLLAVHNLDPLWYPALDEQRVGRIIRQGNLNPEVYVFDYSTEKSFDTQMWGMMQTKGKFLHEFWSDSDEREMEDVTMDDYYETAKAIVSGDPRLERLASMRKEVAKLETKKISHERKAHGLKTSKRDIAHEVDSMNRRVQQQTKLLAARQDTSGDNFTLTLEWEGQNATTFTKRKDAQQALEKAHKYANAVFADTKAATTVKIGTFAGFDMRILSGDNSAMDLTYVHLVVGGTDLFFGFDSSKSEMIRTMESQLRQLEQRLENVTEVRDSKVKQQADLEQMEVGGPFPQQDKMTGLKQDIKDLQAEMAPVEETPDRPGR